jgi:N-acyl-phosphatidylethanolamine-hydrolysing phospholipase D
MTLGPHHKPGGGFQSPWGDKHGAAGAVKWYWQRMFEKLPPNPPPSELPKGESSIVYPRVGAADFRATWVGHASVLLQVGGVNILIDPIWSRRCFPVQWAGPARLVPPGLDFDALPPIDIVVISHDHYDHLDKNTVKRLAARFGDAPTWVAPLVYKRWLSRLGISKVVELDWWQEGTVPTVAGDVSLTAVPSRHYTRRNIFFGDTRLWASFTLRAPGGHTAFLTGDSGYFPESTDIGDRYGPFDFVTMPIGAYDPRWFMKPTHMCPEESVRTYQNLGASGVMLSVHWGTFRLTDEAPLEPPVRLKAAWEKQGLPPGDLWIARRGDTRIIAGSEASESEFRRT